MNKTFASVTCLITGLLLTVSPPRCLGDDSVAASLPPGATDVVKLVKAGLGEDVVMAEIRSKGASYSFTADQLIYLHQQGVTPNEITAMIGNPPVAPAPSPPLPVPSTPAPTPAPALSAPTQPPLVSITPSTPAPAPSAVPAAPSIPPSSTVPMSPTVPDPSATPSLEAFQAQLAGYGGWVNVAGLGLCWRPSVAVQNPYWRPYFDQGHWVYTADGWCWQSDYPWGDVVFHYGRWQYTSVGWVWAPGYDWAPAWVCWRQADGYCGWAPLPPSAVYRPGLGLYYDGRLAVDIDFGLGINAFTFVPYDRFWEHDLHAFVIGRDRIGFVFGRSYIMNGYHFDHGRFIVGGIGRERMALLTRHEIHEEAVHREIRHDEHFRDEHRGGRDEHRH
jgi:hypothetical protein